MCRLKLRLLLVTEIIAPYRIPVFNALAACDDIDLHVIFLSETDPILRQWHVYKDEIRFSYEVLPAWRYRWGKHNLLVNVGVTAALERQDPQAILCGGYNYVASWQAAWWAGRNKVPLLLWSESTRHDLRRRWRMIERMKVCFARRCVAFVSAGTSSHDYLAALGAPYERIFGAPNAVDVNFYATHGAKARSAAAEVRRGYALPERYFLYAGRLIAEKGVFDLLAAYAKLEPHKRSEIGLVFAGDGASRLQLAKQAAAIHPGYVVLAGFVHREKLAELYALSDALVLPTHSDTWGLVVNEAMACGLPVIATDVAGCVPDLVEDGDNGFIVPARNVGALAGAMTRLSDLKTVARMGARSASRILAFTPEACAEGMAKAVRFVCRAKVSTC